MTHSEVKGLTAGKSAGSEWRREKCLTAFAILSSHGTDYSISIQADTSHNSLTGKNNEQHKSGRMD